MSYKFKTIKESPPYEVVKRCGRMANGSGRMSVKSLQGGI